jgi:hypothetical protein
MFFTILSPSIELSQWNYFIFFLKIKSEFIPIRTAIELISIIHWWNLLWSFFQNNLNTYNLLFITFMRRFTILKNQIINL